MTEEKIGVYVCHCGSNIAGTVDVEDVSKWAGEELKRPRRCGLARLQVHVLQPGPGADRERYPGAWSDPGCGRGLLTAPYTNRPSATHLPAPVLNPYLTELVSIREQVSWVHTDKVAATEKAKYVVSGGVERVIHHEPLEPLHVPVNPATLVVGGGIAGIQSALEIADAGFPVYLVETRAIHRRAHVPVRQDVPHPGLFRLYPDA